MRWKDDRDDVKRKERYGQKTDGEKDMDRITKRLARKGTLGWVKICDETYTIRKSRIF